MSSDRLNAPSFDTTTSGAGSLVEARFIPQRYEPNYAYPLLVALPRPRGRRAADGPVDAGPELAELRRPESARARRR